MTGPSGQRLQPAPLAPARAIGLLSRARLSGARAPARTSLGEGLRTQSTETTSIKPPSITQSKNPSGIMHRVFYIQRAE